MVCSKFGLFKVRLADAPESPAPAGQAGHAFDSEEREGEKLDQTTEQEQKRNRNRAGTEPQKLQGLI